METNLDTITININGRISTFSKAELPSNLHSEIRVLLEAIRRSVSFFSSPQKNKLGRHPMRKVYFDIEPYLKYIDDNVLRELCSQAANQRKIMDETNLKLFETIAVFLGYGDSVTKEVADKIGRKRDRMKKGEIPPWVDLPHFSDDLKKLTSAQSTIERLEPLIVERLISVYDYSYIKHFGNDQAKTLIRSAESVKPTTAIRYLQKAISYGEPTYMSYRAHLAMGQNYWYLGNYKATVDSLSTSIEHFKLATVNMYSPKRMRIPLLFRGLSYIKLGNNELAIEDLRAATQEPIEELVWLPYKKEFEEALSFLAQASARK